jgi:hypothetical protein
MTLQEQIRDTRQDLENIANWLAFQFPYNVPAGMSAKGVWERATYGVIEMSGATPAEALERNQQFVAAFRAANPIVFEDTEPFAGVR